MRALQAKQRNNICEGQRGGFLLSAAIFLFDQTLAGHFGGLGEPHDLEHGRADVRQTAALLQLAGIAHHAEGHR